MHPLFPLSVIRTSVAQPIPKIFENPQTDFEDREPQQHFARVVSLPFLLGRGVPKRIFVHNVGRINLIRLDEVLYFRASTNYTIIVMKDGTRLTTSKTMRAYDERIAGHPDFLRIHRSYIINKNKVISIIKRGKEHRFFVEMCNSDRLEISYAKKDEILQKIVN